MLTANTASVVPFSKKNPSSDGPPNTSSQHKLEKGKRRCLMLIICTAAITTCFMMVIGTNLHQLGGSRRTTSNDTTVPFIDPNSKIVNRNRNVLLPSLINPDPSSNHEPLSFATLLFRRRIQESTQSQPIMPKAAEIVIIVVLTLFSALFAGLILGLMSLDVTQLEIVMKSRTNAKAASNAQRIYPLRVQGNLLLCTLIWANQGCMALQAILMAELLSPVVGFVISTVVLVIFAEILPQAVCSRYALEIGGFCSPFIRVLMVLLFPISFPFSWMLDKMLGRELGTVYTKNEFEQLLKIQQSRGVGFNMEMTNVLAGALKYQDMKVSQVMTPIEEVYMLSADEKLSYHKILAIFKTGHSRIPIYEGTDTNDVIGLLLTKDLIFVDPEDEVTVSSFVDIFGRSLHTVWPDDSLGDVLRELKKGKSHLALVRDVNNTYTDRDPFYESKGIITLEDIIEVILGDEIYDETDAFNEQLQSSGTDRIEFDWDKLRLLDSKHAGTTLNRAERKTMVAFLREQFSEELLSLSDNKLEKMIESTAVSEINAALDQSDGNLLYKKGSPSDLCTIILSGKLTVLAGTDEFRSEMGPWSVLAAKALVDNDYTPDYSAFVSSGSCRCLRIQRTSPVAEEKEDCKTQGSDTLLVTESDNPNMESNEENDSAIKERKSNIRSELLAVFNDSVRSFEMEDLKKRALDRSMTLLKSKLTEGGAYAPLPMATVKRNVKAKSEKP